MAYTKSHFFNFSKFKLLKKVTLEGATFSDVWPSQNEILSIIKTKIGNPIEVTDVEDDALKLLSTGLFSRVRPVFTRASEEDAASFIPKFACI